MSVGKQVIRATPMFKSGGMSDKVSATKEIVLEWPWATRQVWAGRRTTGRRTSAGTPSWVRSRGRAKGRRRRGGEGGAECVGGTVGERRRRPATQRALSLRARRQSATSLTYLPTYLTTYLPTCKKSASYVLQPQRRESRRWAAEPLLISMMKKQIVADLLVFKHSSPSLRTQTRGHRTLHTDVTPRHE